MRPVTRFAETVAARMDIPDDVLNRPLMSPRRC
jgi:hypothetical protein